MRLKMLGIAVLVAVSLVAAGCGGSSSNDTAGDTTELVDTTSTETTDTTDTTMAGTETTATTETTETETTETETTSDTTSADDLAKLLGSEECASLIGLSATFAQAMSAAGGNDDQVEQSKKFFEELADKAPAEIRDDFAVLSEAFTKIAEAYADLDLKPGATPTAEAIAKLSKLGQELDNEKFNNASANIEAWSNEHCNTGG